MKQSLFIDDLIFFLHRKFIKEILKIANPAVTVIVKVKVIAIVTLKKNQFYFYILAVKYGK